MAQPRTLTALFFLLCVVLAGAVIYVWKTDNNWVPVDVIETWTTATSTTATFLYPTDFGTDFVTPIEWPPVVNMYEDEYSCSDIGKEEARAGRTEERKIGDIPFCVTKVQEGAAGSMYTQYTYIFDNYGSLIAFTFTTRSVQCLNYDEPKQSTCLEEQEELNIDEIVRLMAQTLTLK